MRDCVQLFSKCRPETQVWCIDKLDKSTLANCKDRIEDGGHGCQCIHVPEADDGPAFCPHEMVAAIVVFALRMLAAVEFDDEPLFAAGEVCIIWTYRILADELEAIQPSVAKFGPEFRFGVVIRLSKSSGAAS